MEKNNIKERYLNSAKSFTIQRSKEERLLLILSALRLLVFIGGIILIWLGYTQSFISGLFLTLVIPALFFLLLQSYSVHNERREFLNNLAIVNQNEANALSGDLSAFDGGSIYIDTSHDFSNDVDLFGNLSFFQYLNRTVTGFGRDILAAWLSDPYALTPGFIKRQQAILELSGKEKWRHEFLARGMKKPFEKRDIIDLMQWMREESSIKSSFLKRFLIIFLPSVSIVSLLLLILGILQYPVFVFFFLLNLLYIATGLKDTNKIHNALSRKYNYLYSLNGLLKTFMNESFTSGKLNEIKLNISGSGVSAVLSLKKLSRLIQAFDNRMNILVGFALNGLLLWDYICILRLEKWKAEFKDLFPVWLEMLGEVDALISFSNYAANNPDFTYPVISTDTTVFSAKNLGHQLIEANKRVCNDFKLERHGTICIVSGANMAGKSTFLRTIAINYILGMAGAPVCAEKMKFIPLKLFTSMRTTDSLSNNESYFYAELKRLKLLKAKIENGEPVLFILDEILKGTNSADKSLGSKLFLTKMIELGATGLIATHDTSLGELESSWPAQIINKCFEIEIEGENIKFDYKLHNGITRKMNAAFLMKQMGILE
jgi:hypothetical protein